MYCTRTWRVVDLRICVHIPGVGTIAGTIDDATGAIGRPTHACVDSGPAARSANPTKSDGDGAGCGNYVGAAVG